MTKRKPKHLHKKNGRPTVMTADTLQKLEDAFAFTYSDEEACLYAGISPRTLYNYQEENPEFVQRKEILRLTPNLVTKKELVESIKGNLGQAQWWATHRIPEFREKMNVEQTIKVEHILSPALKSAIHFYRNIRRAEIEKNIKELPA